MSHHYGKMQKKNCEICGTEFETDNKHKRFCSIKCANIYRGKLRRKEDTCKMCGKTFYSRSHNLFCSKECKREWKLNQEEIRKNRLKVYKDYELICEECGKKFTSHNKRARFCSSSCASTHNMRHLKKYRNCEYCGEPFHKKNMCGVKFCSDDCRKKYNEERRIELQKIKKKAWIKLHTKRCPICNKTFIAKYTYTACCSDDCYKKYNRLRSREYSAKKHKIKIVECKNCGTIFEREYGDKRSVFCCKDCNKSYLHRQRKNNEKYKIKKKEESKTRNELIKNNYVEPVNYKKIYDRDCGICQICGLPVNKDAHETGYWDGTIDHIIPLSLGGEHSMKNCQLSHRCCNSIKNQSTGKYKIDWNEKSKENNYFAKRFEDYKKMMGILGVGEVKS